MCKPRLLLLDEPTGGLTRADVDAIGDLLRSLRDEAGRELTVLLVEHNVPFVFGLCDSVTAMELGKEIVTAAPSEIRANEQVIRSYLGVGISPKTVEHRPEHQDLPVVLKVEGVSSGYDSVVVLHDVSLEVREGETVALFGRNGAGKSTLLNTLLGEPRARSGSITWRGRQIERRTVQSIVRGGIGLVPQDRAVLERQTVDDNLLISTFGLRLSRREFRQRVEETYERFPLLARRRHEAGASLSGGERQMLAIAKVLIRRPTLLLLDEPSIGLAPTVVEELHHIVARLSREGLSVLVGEQNVGWVVPIATRAYVIETGRIIAEGPAEKLAESESLTERYLGDANAPQR
jgi:ABC-type branched-subunit amino acid transport system ATPase component